MLRITKVEGPSGAPTLRLEGRVVDEGVGVLVQELERLPALEAVSLELGSVEFVSGPGVAVLKDAIGRGARVKSVTPFVQSLLDGGIR